MVSQSAGTPYLSLVVAARHDDHGGNFMRRMQAFLSAFVEQCRRFQLQAEVIVVEWNPLPDRCGLAEALEWPEDPKDLEWCQVRFIEVPPEIHSRFRHGAKIPLYQMIAKNVGIRHARGEWVLATNIDIFFNDALMSFLAARQLDRTKMYRIDRHDAGDGFPLWASASQQLDYCEKNILRISAKEATFALNQQGHRTWPGPDIVDTARLGLGEGWFPPEMQQAKPIRNFNDGAIIEVPALSAPETLVLWLDPGINAAGSIEVSVTAVSPDGAQSNETPLVARTIKSLTAVRVPLEASAAPVRLRVGVKGEWKPRIHDVRLLLARAWSVSLGAPKNPPLRAKVRSLNLADRSAIWMRRNAPGIHAVLAPPYRLATGRPLKARSATAMRQDIERPAAETARKPPVFLHTNACGDFTLLHRDAWFDLRGYPEFDAYSMNIDSVLCWAAHYAGYSEAILADPMRIYHMEHGAGSGWTPEGAELLYKRITGAGLPWLEYQELLGWVECMHSWERPILFNGANWGLADDTLRETAPALGEAFAHLRWCKNDPESPSRKRELAQANVAETQRAAAAGS